MTKKDDYVVVNSFGKRKNENHDTETSDTVYLLNY